jgi:hypothetical protein
MSTRPPSGASPPTRSEVYGLQIDLVALARTICKRYYVIYPDEHERYGAAGVDWCHHDNQWLLSWAAGDVIGAVDLDEQACWLARVLHGRDFPVKRLIRNLQLAAEVTRESEIGPAGPTVAQRLEKAAAAVGDLHLG